MKICIPIVFTPQGGGFYFLEAFQNYLTAHGHAVSRSVGDRYNVLFTSHWLVSRRDIIEGLYRNPDARLVQRIDGAAADYGRDPEADRRQRAVNRLTDLTIFQSDYARFATRERFLVIDQDGPTIHNPVDAHRFSPDGDRLSFPESRRVASVSWSTNPRKGARAIYETAARNPLVGFYLCGRYLDVPRLPNLHELGVLNRDQLPPVLRSCDALLTYSENEACPNHVLEALASALPVLYRDSGAMSEIVGDCGIAVEPDTFAEALEHVAIARTEWATRARRRALTHFDPETIFAGYVRELAAALDRPPRVRRRRRALLAWSSRLTRR